MQKGLRKNNIITRFGETLFSRLTQLRPKPEILVVFIPFYEGVASLVLFSTH
jgi:hypothetical protein